MIFAILMIIPISIKSANTRGIQYSNATVMLFFFWGGGGGGGGIFVFFICFLPSQTFFITNMSHPMGKPTICIGENKVADQLRGNREADQRLCFRYKDSTITLLSKSKISSF